MVARVESRIGKLNELMELGSLDRTANLHSDLWKLTLPTLDHLDTILAQTQIMANDLKAQIAGEGA